MPLQLPLQHSLPAPQLSPDALQHFLLAPQVSGEQQSLAVLHAQAINPYDAGTD